MSAPLPIMIFAAGRGTRMGALTEMRPKPLIEVAGRPLIDHALDLCADAPVRVANTHYLPEALEAHLARRGVGISRESELLDSGGGLKQALPLLGGGTVMTLNADAVWSGPNPLSALREAWDGDRMDALLALVPLDRAHGREGGGDFSRDEAGRLTRGGGFVHTGAQIIRGDVVSAIGERVFSLNRAWDAAIAAGRLFGIVWPGDWADVGHPGGIGAAEAMLKARAGV